MDIKYLLLTLALFFASSAIAQSSGLKNIDRLDKAFFSVTYQFDQIVSSENDLFVQTDTMLLLIGKTYSLYKTFNRTLKDSLLVVTKKEVDSRRKVVNHYGTYEEFASTLNYKNNVGLWTKNWETADLYKNRINGKLTIIDELEDFASIKVEDSITQFQWEISADTMNIIGYTCHNASVNFRGRKFTAWFAPDIPINDGPWKFYGLPGLILHIEDNDQLFKFTAIGIKAEGNEMFISLDGSKKYQEPTLKQYNKMKANNKKEARYFSLQGSELNMFSGENRTKYNLLEIEE